VEADILSKRWGAGGAAAAPSAAEEALLAAAGPVAGELRDVAAAQRSAADEAAGARQQMHRAANRSFPSLDRSVATPAVLSCLEIGAWWELDLLDIGQEVLYQVYLDIMSMVATSLVAFSESPRHR
jgi:hypothetical protein